MDLSPEALAKITAAVIILAAVVGLILWPNRNATSFTSTLDNDDAAIEVDEDMSLVAPETKSLGEAYGVSDTHPFRVKH